MPPETPGGVVKSPLRLLALKTFFYENAFKGLTYKTIYDKIRYRINKGAYYVSKHYTNYRVRCSALILNECVRLKDRKVFFLKP